MRRTFHALAWAVTPTMITMIMMSAPASAQPESADQQFLQAMNAVGLVSDGGPAGLIRLAHAVCNDRANGYSDLISATMVNNGNPGLGMNGAGFIVAAAEHVYCPQFSSPLPPS